MTNTVKIVKIRPTRAQMQLHNLVNRAVVKPNKDRNDEILKTIMYLEGTINACRDELITYATEHLGFVVKQEFTL